MTHIVSPQEVYRLDTAARCWTVGGDRDAWFGCLLSNEYEEAWLPIVGPSVLVLVRYCGRRLAVDGEFRIEPCELAYRLGLAGSGANSPFSKTLQRAQRFGLLTVADRATFAVQTDVILPTQNERRRQRVRSAWGVRA